MATKTEQKTPVLEERDHLRECPMERTETYREVRPGRPEQGIPPRPVMVARCIDCGAHLVKEIN